MGGRLFLEDLHKTYRGASSPALDGIQLQVSSGTILVLLGTSGAGKTTLLRVIAGLEEADSGRVVLDDRVLSDPRVRVAPEKRGVGLVFQHLELWAHMSVAENIAFGLTGRPRGRAAVRHPVVEEIAEQVGVASLLDRGPATLSGGERQRVAIARTLAPAPNVILYDEPLANLDPERRADLRRLIRRVCRAREATLVYVTHDAEEAMEMGDEIAVLGGGRVIDAGPPASLYRSPASVVSARALGAVNAFDARLDDGVLITAVGRLPAAPDATCTEGLALVRPECVDADGDLPAVIVESRPRGSGWSFVARVEETLVQGISSRPLVANAAVGLGIRGPAVLVPAVPDEGESACSTPSRTEEVVS